MAPLVATALYRRLYCRPRLAGGRIWTDSRARRILVDELSRANCGIGTWEPGWSVTVIEEGGSVVVHKHNDGLTLWARPDQFRPVDGVLAVGTVGHLRVGKELREMLPGYYTAIGDAETPADAVMVRLYWHLTAELAPAWMGELTRRLNRARIAFHAKAPSDPADYVRADAGVLYMSKADVLRALQPLREMHGVLSSGLGSATPMFTRRLARGLAIAEDPGDGSSFGQHRCRLVAEGLLQAFAAGQTENIGRATAIAARFSEEGLSITRPWLSAGSRQRYALAPPRPGIDGTSPT
jgi:hypothetical protein